MVGAPAVLAAGKPSWGRGKAGRGGTRLREGQGGPARGRDPAVASTTGSYPQQWPGQFTIGKIASGQRSPSANGWAFFRGQG